MKTCWIFLKSGFSVSVPISSYFCGNNHWCISINIFLFFYLFTLNLNFKSLNIHDVIFTIFLAVLAIFKYFVWWAYFIIVLKFIYKPCIQQISQHFLQIQNPENPFALDNLWQKYILNTIYGMKKHVRNQKQERIFSYSLNA